MNQREFEPDASPGDCFVWRVSLWIFYGLVAWSGIIWLISECAN